MSYNATETAEQKAFKLAAIEFVRKASLRARERRVLRLLVNAYAEPQPERAPAA